MQPSLPTPFPPCPHCPRPRPPTSSLAYSLPCSPRRSAPACAHRTPLPIPTSCTFHLLSPLRAPSFVLILSVHLASLSDLPFLSSAALLLLPLYPLYLHCAPPLLCPPLPPFLLLRPLPTPHPQPFAASYTPASPSHAPPSFLPLPPRPPQHTRPPAQTQGWRSRACASRCSSPCPCRPMLPLLLKYQYRTHRRLLTQPE
ncbi:hypothetical protein DFH09DRAFT_1154807, partial [Mycena vulgaris]